jgi:1,4-dihydroxy-2-naphthoyl-CoA hydrolase
VQHEELISGFAHWLGLEVVEATGDRVELAWKVRPELWQPYGIVHGGVHCSVVETAASTGAALWMEGRGMVVGVSNQTDFLRPVREGDLHAVATPIHRGRLQQLWQVEIKDSDDRAVARGQVRLQNIDNEHLAVKRAD